MVEGTVSRAHRDGERRDRPRVVVAGASGFVGRALGAVLDAHDFEAIGLTRDAERYAEVASPYRWKSCQLYSLLEAERALEGADYAVYLVHSMMPSARLTQGSFQDLDLVCADNFARAARRAGVRHIIYLGGLLPEHGDLSEHLASRLEVERVLSAYGVPVTTLRAGLVIGAGGSSFQMMLRLVRRLPAMVCPSWTNTRTQPVALDDVVQVMVRALGDERFFGGAFDLGVPEAMTYREMMERTAGLLGVKRPMLGVPLMSPRLSRLWVSLVTGAPRELVAPLLESLRHELVVGDRSAYTLTGVEPTSFDDAVRRSIAPRPKRSAQRPRAFEGAQKQNLDVRSVQRLAMPRGRDARWAAEQYMSWLPRAMWPFITVDVDEERCCRFMLRGVRRPLLTLEFSPDRSHDDRQLFYVVGGLLSEDGGRGRLEMRMVPNSAELICAIHDFRPRLPWFLYLATQAWGHLLVMKAFGRHLRAAAT